MVLGLTMLACAGVLFPAPPSRADEHPIALVVRAAPHDAYGRIVFEPPSPMSFSAAVEDGVLVVRFEKPATAALATIAKSLADYVTGVPLTVDGPVVRIPLKRPVKVRTFTEGLAMVVDLVTVKGGAGEARAISALASSAPTPLEPSIPVKAAASPPASIIPLRVGEHDAYSRLVFDLDKPTAYSVDEEQKGEVILRIATRAKLGPEPQKLPHRVGAIASSLDDDGLSVHLRIMPGGHVRHFLSGSKIVLDVYGADFPHGAVPSLQAASAAQSGEEHPPSGNTQPKTAEASDAQSSPPARSVAVPLPARTTRAQSAVGPAAAASVPTQADVGVTVAHANDATTIRFTWPAGLDPAAAVFIRAGYLWAIFDHEAAFDFVEWARSDGRPEAVHPGSGTSAVRLKLSDLDLGASVTRDGRTWTIVLRTDAPRPRAPDLEVRNGENGRTALFVPAPGAGSRIALKDPDIGDTLLVLPFRRAGVGLGVERRYADFHLLATAEGIVVEPLADGVAATADSSGFEISSAAGLNLTPPTARIAHAPARTGRIFNFAAWRTLGGTGGADATAHLQEAVLAAAAPDRNARRLDLAHYYFAIGAAAETLGVLDAIASDQRELMDQPEIKALRGAARLQMNDVAGAANDLLSPSLDGAPDVAPWRGALAVARHEWTTAVREFALGESELPQYPPAFRVRFALSATEAALEVGDPSRARVYLATVETLEPSDAALDRLHWLEGRAFAAFGEYEKADAKWRKAIAGGDPWVRAHARFDRATTLLQAGKIARSEAISELEKLTFTWRGDGLEYRVLTTLGDLQLAEGETRQGLEALRKAVSHFPDMPGVDEVSARMRDAFVKFHTDGHAAKAPALTDLALFEEFGDLVPDGPEGNAIVGDLVGRLVQLDLLDRAENLLADLADHRLKGAAAAKARNQLGLVYLMDRKPAKALEALDHPIAADGDSDIAAARRELRARALLDTGKYAEALKILDGDDSDAARNLRADLFWRTNDWSQAAAALALLSAGFDPAHLSDRDARVVMRGVIARALAGDAKGLAEVNSRFGAAMAATPFKDAFGLLTDSSPVSPTSIQAVTAQVAAADRFGAFLESYRTKLLKTTEAAAKPRTSAAAEAPASSAVN